MNIALNAEMHADREWELICAAEEAELSVDELLAARERAAEEAAAEEFEWRKSNY
jgi:hypothetical protein